MNLILIFIPIILIFNYIYLINNNLGSSYFKHGSQKPIIDAFDDLNS